MWIYANIIGLETRYSGIWDIDRYWGCVDVWKSIYKKDLNYTIKPTQDGNCIVSKLYLSPNIYCFDQHFWLPQTLRCNSWNYNWDLGTLFSHGFRNLYDTDHGTDIFPIKSLRRRGFFLQGVPRRRYRGYVGVSWNHDIPRCLICICIFSINPQSWRFGDSPFYILGLMEIEDHMRWIQTRMV